MTETRYCKAAAWVTFRGQSFPVLPAYACKCFLILIGCLIAFVAIVEWRLTTFAGEGRVASTMWEQENDRIKLLNHKKADVDDKDPRWRSAGIPLPGKAAPGRSRILVVGDSFVWGDGYANVNDIWWRQLERELRHRGYADVDVVAAGVNGASTQDELAWVRNRGLEGLGSPDLVIFGYVTNDPDVHDANGKQLVNEQGNIVGQPRWTFLQDSLGRVAPNLTKQLVQRQLAKWESRIPNVYPYAEWELKILEPPNIDAYRDVVSQLGETMRATGKPYFFLTLPNWPGRKQFSVRYEPVERIFDAAGIPFHNLLDDFVRQYDLGDDEVLKWGINPANGHPGPVATRFYAREAADILEQQYPEVLGPKLPTPVVEPPKINDWMPPKADVEQIGGGQWEFTYPRPRDEMLNLPIGERHVLLSFAEPTPIERLRLSGSSLTAAEVYLGAVNAKTGIEEKSLTLLGRRSGGDLTWDLHEVEGAQRANTLRIAAEFAPGADRPESRKLRLTIDSAATAAALR